jgi:hypothetical protein
VWCDRAAIALGVVTSVVDEHRAWILERFGASGARFLRYADGLATLVSFYAVGRVATAVPRILAGFRNAYLEMKALKATLSVEEKATLDLLGRRTDEAIRLVEDAGKRGGDVIPIERARQPAMVMEEVQIRATGTEGKLVPVASAGEGGGGANKPLRPAPPQSSETRTTGGRSSSTAAVARAIESEIAAALMRRGLSESQASVFG